MQLDADKQTHHAINKQRWFSRHHSATVWPLLSTNKNKTMSRISSDRRIINLTNSTSEFWLWLDSSLNVKQKGLTFGKKHKGFKTANKEHNLQLLQFNTLKQIYRNFSKKINIRLLKGEKRWRNWVRETNS